MGEKTNLDSNFVKPFQINQFQISSKPFRFQELSIPWSPQDINTGWKLKQNDPTQLQKDLPYWNFILCICIDWISGKWRQGCYKNMERKERNSGWHFLMEKQENNKDKNWRVIRYMERSDILINSIRRILQPSSFTEIQWRSIQVVIYYYYFFFCLLFFSEQWMLTYLAY